MEKDFVCARRDNFGAKNIGIRGSERSCSKSLHVLKVAANGAGRGEKEGKELAY